MTSEECGVFKIHFSVFKVGTVQAGTQKQALNQIGHHGITWLMAV